MTIVLSVVIGVSTGVISSALVWYSLTHRFVPKIEISPYLSSYVADGKRRSQVKFVNVGKRDVYDVELVVALGISGLVRTGTTEWTTVKTGTVPILTPGSYRMYAVATTGIERPERYFRVYPPELVDRLERGDHVPFVELLELGDDAFVAVTVSGRDSFSQAFRKTQRRIGRDGVREGKHIKKSLEVGPYRPPTRTWIADDGGDADAGRADEGAGRHAAGE